MNDTKVEQDQFSREIGLFSESLEQQVLYTAGYMAGLNDVRVFVTSIKSKCTANTSAMVSCVEVPGVDTQSGHYKAGYDEGYKSNYEKLEVLINRFTADS